MMEQVDRALVVGGMPIRRLPGGGGHDAMAIAEICPAAMLFVRCRGGISHHPDEAVSGEDADHAKRVVLRFIREFHTNEEPA
ncbi:MAG: allantoate deiminase [Gammaproteobacteria bacterium]|jgi:allantoate deiminase